MAQRVTEFDVWRPGYGGSSVQILRAGTNELLPVYSDTALTAEANNPQTLMTTVDGGANYGKFSQPIYVGEAYYLVINDTTQTGVTQISLTTVAGEDVSESVVATRRGQRTREVQDALDQIIFALDYGPIDETSSATNTATINAAIGAAAAQGGGVVRLPAGDVPFTILSLPDNVVLRGEGILATTLRSTEGQEVVTIAGEFAGLQNLTLDGVNLIAGSIGVHSEANDYVVMDAVRVRRFETNMKFEGGSGFNWRDLFVENGQDGVLWLGEGAPMEHNTWVGGAIRQHTGDALALRFDDDWVRFNRLQDVEFSENVGDNTVTIDGARYTRLCGCSFVDCTRPLDVRDGTDTSEADRNTVVGVTVENSRFDGGTLLFDDTCEAVRFTRCDFQGTTFRMELPDNFVILEDCTEDAAVQVTQNAKQLLRDSSAATGEGVGVTTDGSAVTAWEMEIRPGRMVTATAKVVALRRDGLEHAGFYKMARARRQTSRIYYDNEVTAFSAGAILTGQTSGATARIADVTDNGSDGHLNLRDIIGTFEDNETITDSQGGEAIADGPVVDQDAQLRGSVDTIGTDYQATGATNYDANFDVNGGKIRLRVEGDTDHIVEWSFRIEVFT